MIYREAYIWDITCAKYVSIVFVTQVIGYTKGYLISIFDHAVQLLPDDLVVDLDRESVVEQPQSDEQGLNKIG